MLQQKKKRFKIKKRKIVEKKNSFMQYLLWGKSHLSNNIVEKPTKDWF